MITTVRNGFFVGSLSGITLGLFFKAIELITGQKVYRLLLNIDYIPVLKQIHFPEIIEFLFHIAVSIIISIALLLLMNYQRWIQRRIIILTTLLNICIGLLFFPTTALSDQTPEITNIPALLLWLVGHLIYGLILGILLRTVTVNHNV
ncbi:hypothetical protein [Radiobacillus sp. PE A8.2]|uniref:hypothetical protein n=1 Tax=Radiobacillus sp. PE A8.2 TaxID=3380349 RepID=UPI00388F6C46